MHTIDNNNPFTDMLASLDPDRFIGRTRELALIIPGLSATLPKSFSITGIRTIGKTSLLQYLANENGALKTYEELLGSKYINGGGARLLFVYLNFHYYGESDELFNLLLQRLSQLIREQSSSEYESTLSEFSNETTSKYDSVKALRKLVEKLLQASIRVVFLLDDFEPVLKKVTNEEDMFLRSLMELSSFVFVTEQTMPEIRPELADVSPALNILHTRTLGQLYDEEATSLVKEPLRESTDQFTDTEVKFVIDLAGKHPFILTLVCERYYELHKRISNIERLIRENDRFRQQFMIDLGRYPSIIETFALFWNRLGEPDEREAIIRIIQESDTNLIKKHTIQKLENKSLIYSDYQQGSYRIFSPLFGEYVVHQNSQILGIDKKLSSDEIQELASTLPPLDKRLLQYLLVRSNQVCSFDDLLFHGWGSGKGSKRALEAAITRLRKHLQVAGSSNINYIQNVWGKGYQLILDETTNLTAPLPRDLST